MYQHSAERVIKGKKDDDDRYELQNKQIDSTTFKTLNSNNVGFSENFPMSLQSSIECMPAVNNNHYKNVPNHRRKIVDSKT